VTRPADDSEVLAVVAALLDTGRDAGHLSRALTVLAFAGLLAPLWGAVPAVGMVLLMVAAVAGLGGAYAGARVGLDAALFRHLGAAAQGPTLLDAALVRLGMLPDRKAGRSLGLRVMGAQRLLRVQVALLGVQAAALVGAGVWAASG